MINRYKFIAAVALALLSPAFIGNALASEALHPREMHWSFEGPFGKFDRPSIQRGFQVYKEVCAGCHSLRLLSYRNLQEVGFSEAEVKALAAEYTVKDGPNDDGEMFDRPAKPSDRFVAPFPNEKAARAANNGAFPPDQSLLVKARHDGANYTYSILTGYGEKMPGDFHLGDTMNYNPYFPGGQIAMAAPLSDGAVTYMDGTNATVDQMSRDVVNFLQWAAEPEMETRKELGIKTLAFLFIMTGFFYLAKLRIWARLHTKKHH